MAQNRNTNNHGRRRDQGTIVSSGEQARKRRAQNPPRLMLEEPGTASEQPTFDAKEWVKDFPLKPYDGQDHVTDAFARSTMGAYVEAVPVTNITSARRAARALALLAAHVCSSGGTLTVKQALDPRTIDQFHDAQLRALKARASNLAPNKRGPARARAEITMREFRSALRRVGEVVNPNAPWEPAPPRGYRQIKPPYQDADITAFEAQLVGMRAAHARCAEAFLVLGLGAGLDGRWAAKVTTEHVQVAPDGGFDIVLADRVVPVLAGFEERLGRLLAQAKPGEFLIGGAAKGANAANEAVARLRFDAAGPQFDLSRLRSTWLVHHLTIGTRVPELMEAAGLQGMTVLGDLAEFVPPLHADRATSITAARALLRAAPARRKR